MISPLMGARNNSEFSPSILQVGKPKVETQVTQSVTAAHLSLTGSDWEFRCSLPEAFAFEQH